MTVHDLGAHIQRRLISEYYTARVFADYPLMEPTSQQSLTQRRTQGLIIDRTS